MSQFKSEIVLMEKGDRAVSRVSFGTPQIHYSNPRFWKNISPRHAKTELTDKSKMQLAAIIPFETASEYFEYKNRGNAALNQLSYLY